MPWIALLVFAVVQGITEFLPVSSSSHLYFAHRLLNGGAPVPERLFDLLHLGTLCALAWRMRREIKEICTVRTSWIKWLALGTVPAVLLGPPMAPVKDQYELIPWGLLITCGFLIVAQRKSSRVYPPRREPETSDALLVGLAQVASLCPGVSRLGMTFGSGLICGLDRAQALAFAVLLSLPASAGKFALGVIKGHRLLDTGLSPAQGAAAFAATAAVGYFAFPPCYAFLKNRSLTPIAIYCGLAATAALILG